MITNMIRKYFFAGLVCCAVAAVLTSCSADEQTDAPASPLRFHLYDANVTRAATDGQTMTTTFELADQAGLYIVKNGQVLMSNIPLTYNAAGFWEAATPISASDELKSAQFYAYYPYRADAQFDASSATPFAAMVAAAKPAAKQNTKAEFEAADILVTGAATVGQYNAVNLPLAHQRALVCMELPNSSYIFDNEGMEPYVMSKAENVAFTLNGETVQPYFDEASQSYRLIIEPGESAVIKATFTNNGEENSYETADLASMTSGQYAKFVIDGGAQLVNMRLQVGDYYCADGNIVSRDATTVPANAVGVVFKLGTTEAIRNANASWSHAVVLALNEKKSKWGTNSSPSSAQNAAGWKYWYKDYNLADQNGVTDKSKLDESIMSEDGYENTLAWRAVPEPLTIGGETLDYTSVMNTVMDEQMASHPLPAAITTDWYIPSLVDWRNVEAQLSVVKAQLDAAGASTVSNDPYWSSNVRGAGSNWCYQMGKSTVADRYYPSGLKDSRLFRFIFAF